MFVRPDDLEDAKETFAGLPSESLCQRQAAGQENNIDQA
jgi:hypothetical protein